MIYDKLKSLAIQVGESPVLIEGGRGWTPRQLLERAEACSDRLPQIDRATIAISTTNAASLLASLAAVNAVRGVPLIIPSSVSHHEIETCADRFGAAAIIGENMDLREGSARVETILSKPRLPAEADGLILFTSGTSGPPKPVIHSWKSLTAAIRQHESLRRRRWLLAYHPGTFAGLQVICQSLLTGGTLVVGAHMAEAAPLAPDDVAQLFVDQQIEMASATPTFWRWLLHGVAPDRLRQATLRQITLGGEISDQHLLDRLREAFPPARITHIYASTEMGVCFSVHDGRAGFPATWLEDDSLSSRLRVSDSGELLIHSPRRMLRYVDDVGEARGWFATGDLVEISGDRVLFSGRQSDTIHVGGHKFTPASVADVIREIPGVLDVEITGIDSTLAGQLAQADVQIADGLDEQIMRERIQSAARQRLPKHMIPAIISFSPRKSRSLHQQASQT